MKTKIGIADTTFSKVDLAYFALDEINKKFSNVEIVRYTVPGIKDLPVACKKLLEEQNCEACLALGMVGKEPIDQQCAHEASQGIITAQLMTNKHILGAFIHENEAKDEQDLLSICEDRARKHAANTVLLIQNPDELMKSAGMGLRQGRAHVGSIKPKA
ncbi:riboflavin synthase [Candidatus Micrarchaeota archaeon]|nr:riboflavin synthase [Candidatus Micrarchaeota archaeon]